MANKGTEGSGGHYSWAESLEKINDKFIEKTPDCEAKEAIGKLKKNCEKNDTKINEQLTFDGEIKFGIEGKTKAKRKLDLFTDEIMSQLYGKIKDYSGLKFRLYEAIKNAYDAIAYKSLLTESSVYGKITVNSFLVNERLLKLSIRDTGLGEGSINTAMKQQHQEIFMGGGGQGVEQTFMEDKNYRLYSSEARRGAITTISGELR